MSAGEQMPQRAAKWRRCPVRAPICHVLIAAALLAAGAARAIDNPDAPDRTAEFLAREHPYEERVSEQAGAAAQGSAAADYAKFLDAELNRAYEQLNQQLDDDARRGLLQSQRQWLKFRDAEYRFIGRNWTRQNFGSSSSLSRDAYRAALVKQRILTLLDYQRNYPAGPR
jgi:uncharacterized protein YecT (DUF1311 family)